MEKHTSDKVNLNNQKAGLPNDPALLAFIDKLVQDTTKDSEYYKQEKLWNKNQKAKIERLKSRLYKANDNILSSSTRRANELIYRFKNRQDPLRTWLHIDMDMFFCAVAQQSDPSLTGVPFVVGRSIVASANYIARSLGVTSAMPVFLAEKIAFEVQKFRGIKKPLELKIVNENPKEQRRIANVIRNITKKYSTNFYSLGDDEISFDVTDYLLNTIKNENKTVITKCGNGIDSKLGFNKGKCIFITKTDDHEITTKNNNNNNMIKIYNDKAIKDFSTNPYNNKNKVIYHNNEGKYNKNIYINKDNNNKDINNKPIDNINSDNNKHINYNKGSSNNRNNNTIDNISSNSINNIIYNNKEITTYLDYKSATISLIKDIRKQIYIQTNLTASIGAGNNKLIAKIASDYNKPNSYYFVDDPISFLKHLKVRKVTGIGKATEYKLNKLGIKTVGDLHEKRDVIFHLLKGIERVSLLLKGVGIDEDNVCNTTKEESGYSNFSSKMKIKSIGRSCTFRRCKDKDVLISILATLCQSIFKQMKTSLLGFKSIKVTLQTVKLVTYFKTTSFKFVVNSEDYLVNEVMRIIELLLKSIDINNKVKLQTVYKNRFNINKENESILKLKKNESMNVYEFEYVRFFGIRITNLKITDFGKQQTNLEYYIV